MAAMFRKSTAKRNFRRKNYDEDDEERQKEEPASEEKVEVDTCMVPKVAKLKSKAKIEKVSSASSLLSFDDHEGEAEEEDESAAFKVKKSKESRRLMKKIATERKKKVKVKQEIDDVENIENNDIESENQLNSKDYVVDKKKADAKLAALRAELNKMSKLDDEEESDDESENHNGGTSVSSGVGRHEFSIPDAATIHALKKKREMARQLGGDGDFIPLDDTKKVNRFESKSRLIREDDDNDHSDDEDGPINFSVGGKSQQAKKKRQEVQTALINEEEKEADEEEDEDMKRWEEEQIRKGVSGPQLQQEQEQQAFDIPTQSQILSAYEQPTQAYMSGMYPYGGGYNTDAAVNQFTNSSYRMQPLPEIVTVESIYSRMEKRLASLQEVFRVHKLDSEKTTSHLETAEESIVTLVERGQDVEGKFAFYQEMRGYVRDLIECLSEKVPVIDSLEKSMHALLKQRAERFVERRQEDVKDQAAEFLIAQMGKKAAPASLDPVKQRRAAEREGRRSRRRRKREQTQTQPGYHEGMSTDEEETEAYSLKFKNDAAKIMSDSKAIFHDVVDEFSSISAVKVKFEEWKQLCPDSYQDAYIALCLPKLFKSFVRLQLLGWNPLDPKSKDLESMDWYKDLIGLGFRGKADLDPEDDDIRIIPGLVEKALIPKLIGFIEDVWDPLSTTQTTCCFNLVQRIAADYPTVQAKNKQTQKLFTAIIMRLRKSVSDDVYVPLYPKPLLENKSSGALAFFQRQYWSCFKVFSNILMWHGLISTARLHELAVDGLLNRYLLLGLQHSFLYYDSLDKCKSIISVLPRSWFEQDVTPAGLEAFSRFLVTLATSMQRSSAGCSEGEKKKARSGTKKVVQLLLQIKSVEKAEHLASEYDMTELVSNAC